MREIKFRAWDKDSKLMFLLDELVLTAVPLTGIRQNPTGADSVFRGQIMQFTGLLDKSGKDIYEGDIVEWSIFPDDEEPKRIRDVVGFGSGSFKVEKRCELLGLKAPHREMKVIGNIYENPKLLRKDVTNDKTEAL